MSDELEVPAEDGSGVSRRQFVKATVAAGALGAGAAAGALSFVPISRLGKRPPDFPYLGVKALPGSKAPRGIPLIPVRVNEAGELLGDPKHLEWYAYCGRANAPGLAAGFESDNAFRYQAAQDVIEQAREDGGDLWWEPLLGQRVRLADFAEVGKGAPAMWRSDGVERENPLTVLLLRVRTEDYGEAVAKEWFPEGVLGVFATCAHFCCVPTWRVARGGYGKNHWDDITCHCHGSWYSPRDLVEYRFPPTA